MRLLYVLGGLTVLGLLAAAVLGVGAASTPQPVLEPAKAGTQCVADPATMRREHSRMLAQQKHETVHYGVRGAKTNLTSCIACHASTDRVRALETHACISCHTFVAVRMNCFECHATQPPPTAFHPVVRGAGQSAMQAGLAAQLQRLGAAAGAMSASDLMLLSALGPGTAGGPPWQSSQVAQPSLLEGEGARP